MFYIAIIHNHFNTTLIRITLEYHTQIIISKWIAYIYMLSWQAYRLGLLMFLLGYITLTTCWRKWFYPFVFLLNVCELKCCWSEQQTASRGRTGPICSRWPYLQPKRALELEKHWIHRAAQMGHQPKRVPLHDLLRTNTTELISGQTN